MGGHPPRVFDGRPHDWGEMNVPTFATSRIRRSTRNFATNRLGNTLPRMGARGNLPQAENQFHMLAAACAGWEVQPRYIRRAMYRPLC